MDDIKTLASKLHSLAKTISEKGIELKTKERSLLNYKEQKNQYYISQLRSTVKLLVDRLNKNQQLLRNNSDDVMKLISDIQTDDSKLLLDSSEKLLLITSELKSDSNEGEISVDVPRNIPSEIKAEMVEDIKEMHKCFVQGCYRSVVIICGRIIEVGLHRKYYDATGQDILEKNPGIGLGKLIAKLTEKEVSFPPGLTQQIHLVNQVRVFSVHKKQEAFYPSKDQAQAMMLYTMDSIRQLF